MNTSLMTQKAQTSQTFKLDVHHTVIHRLVVGVKGCDVGVNGILAQKSEVFGRPDLSVSWKTNNTSYRLRLC